MSGPLGMTSVSWDMRILELPPEMWIWCCDYGLAVSYSVVGNLSFSVFNSMGGGELGVPFTLQDLITVAQAGHELNLYPRVTLNLQSSCLSHPHSWDDRPGCS